MRTKLLKLKYKKVIEVIQVKTQKERTLLNQKIVYKNQNQVKIVLLQVKNQIVLNHLNHLNPLHQIIINNLNKKK